MMSNGPMGLDVLVSRVEWLAGKALQRVGDANKSSPLNKILMALLIGVAVFFFTPKVSVAQDEEGDESPPPILTFATDLCEIEITPYELELLLEYPLEFYAANMARMHCEPPPAPEYKCKGCQDKRAIVYECHHFTMEPSEPCNTTMCIENHLKLKTCTYVPNGRRQDCRVLLDPNPRTHHIKQIVKELPPGRSCRTNMINPTIFMKTWIGCPECHPFVVEIRCKTDRCEGRVLRTPTLPYRFVCSPRPCPAPEPGEITPPEEITPLGGINPTP